MNHSPFPGFPAIYQSSEDVNATDDTCNHPDQVENKPIRLRYPRYPDKLYDDKEAYGRSLTFNEDDWIVRSRATVIDVDGVEYWPTYPGNFSSIQVQREVNFHSFGKLPYELRSQILEYLLPPPRALQLRSYCWGNHSHDLSLVSCHNHRFDLTVAHIHKESRALFERHYTRILPRPHPVHPNQWDDGSIGLSHDANGPEYYTYFDSKHDVLVLDDIYLIRGPSTRFDEMNLDAVQNVLICPSMFPSGLGNSANTDEVDRTWQFCRDNFPNIKMISLNIKRLGDEDGWSQSRYMHGYLQNNTPQMHLIPWGDGFVGKPSECVRGAVWIDDDSNRIPNPPYHPHSESEMESLCQHFQQIMLDTPHANENITLQIAMMTERCVPEPKTQNVYLVPRKPTYSHVWYYTTQWDPAYVSEEDYEEPAAELLGVAAPFIFWCGWPTFIMPVDEHGMPEIRSEGYAGIEPLFRQAENWEAAARTLAILPSDGEETFGTDLHGYEGVEDLFGQAEGW